MFDNAVLNHEVARVPRIVELLTPAFLLKQPVQQMSQIQWGIAFICESANRTLV